MTTLARSRLTGRPVAASSAVAVLGAGMPRSAVPPDLSRIIRPQAMTRWILPQLSAITPAYIEQTLRGAFTGSHIQQWELFDLMEDTWPRLMKNLGEVKRAVVAMDWKIEPWAEEDTPPSTSAQERAKLVSNAIWRMQPDPTRDENDFAGTVRDLLDAWGKGTSVLEILWEQRDDMKLGPVVAPRATAWVHPQCYGWDTEGRLGLNYAQIERMANASRRTYANAAHPADPGDLGEFPDAKFIVGICKSKTGSPLTTALLRPLAWWWCAANFSADWLMNLAQVFGLPFRWANYADGSSQATIDRLCSMLENMGSAGWAAFPEGTQLQLVESSKTANATPQGDLMDRADKNCDLIVLGQTLTSDTGGMGSGSGSMALGKVHQGVRAEVIESVAGWSAGVLNAQLVKPILRLNYGDDAECPELCPESPKEEDEKANADRDSVLLAAGVPMPRKWFYRRHKIPLPAAGEEVITHAAPAPTTPPPHTPTSGEDAEAPKPKEDAEPVQSRGSDPAEALARAAAADLKPVRDRLQAVLKIQDPGLFKAKLADFARDLEPLRADIARDPQLARELERIIANTFTQALAQA